MVLNVEPWRLFCTRVFANRSCCHSRPHTRTHAHLNRLTHPHTLIHTLILFLTHSPSQSPLPSPSYSSPFPLPSPSPSHPFRHPHTHPHPLTPSFALAHTHSPLVLSPLYTGSNTIFCEFYETDADWASGTPYFVEYYDLHSDPYQMHNAVDSLGECPRIVIG